jgi:hypothetical protein
MRPNSSRGTATSAIWNRVATVGDHLRAEATQPVLMTAEPSGIMKHDALLRP